MKKKKKREKKAKEKEAEQIVLKLKVASHTHPAIQEVVKRGLVRFDSPLGRMVESFLSFYRWSLFLSEVRFASFVSSFTPLLYQVLVIHIA